MIEFSTLKLGDGDMSQLEAFELVKGPQTHTLLYGGGRSGKTMILLYAVISRAVQAPGSTHAVFRHRFNSIKPSIIDGTLPAVLRLQYPELPSLDSMLNKTDWKLELPNSSIVYFGGLDDAERTEKILGQEHSTIYLNECSQIGWDARNKAITRLAQNMGLRVKMFYDCNPPMKGHWIHRTFIEKVQYATGTERKPLARPEAYACGRLNPIGNPHIPQETVQEYMDLPPKERARMWEGKFGEAVEHALWDMDQLEACVLVPGTALPPLDRIFVAVDPSGCSGKDDKRSDEIGIVVVGKGADGLGYVLEDLSGRFGPDGPEGWGRRVVDAYRRWDADAVIAEVNYGGDVIAGVLRMTDENVPVRKVTANPGRGKEVRAEPVATVYRKGLIKHLKHFPELEEQLLGFSTAGWTGQRSPDRADALVWGLTELMVTTVPNQGLLDYYKGFINKQDTAPLVRDPTKRHAEPEPPKGMIPGLGFTAPVGPATVTMMGPPHIQFGSVYSGRGSCYFVEAGKLLADPRDVDDLEGMGFVRCG